MLAQTEELRKSYPLLALGGRPLHASEEKLHEMGTGRILPLVLKYACKALAQLIRSKRAATNAKKEKAKQETEPSEPRPENKTA